MTVHLPPRRPHPMAFGGGGMGRYVIVTVQADDGTCGYGEATTLVDWGGDYGRYYGESAEISSLVINTLLAPVLLGRNPLDIEAAVAAMDRAVKGYPYAKAALDIAIHDLAGKLLGVPVYQLLGGKARDAVPVAHSIGILDDETVLYEASAAVEEGAMTIKLKIGLDRDRDIRVVKAVRREVGPSVEIVADANQGYATTKEAISVVHKIEDCNLRYVEQPVEGIDRLREVRQAVATAVVADESAWSARDVLEIVRAEAADGVSIYTTKPGGLARAKQVAAVAQAAGLFANVNGSGETGVGNAANLHLAVSSTAIGEPCVIPVTRRSGEPSTQIFGAMYNDDIVVSGMTLKEGCIVVPDGPGLGIEIDLEQVERLRVR